MRKLGTFATTLALLLGACATTPEATGPMTLAQALDGPQRSAANRARDVYRHPLETLEFFGISDSMTVVEISPGAGWYTEILAPYLSSSGRYVAAGPVNDASASAARKKSIADFAAKLAADPKSYGRVTMAELGLPNRWAPIAPGTADMVLTFRNVHNWVSGGFEREMFAAFYRSLKSGGVLGIVEHRARPEATLEQMKQSGYMTQDYVVQLATDAGFRFVGWEEINANPKDTKDYADGVWTLPPTLRLGDTDREKYLAIGESDRMTLKFVKP